MPASLQSRESKGQPGLGTRLDGWKEIAGYLGRGERTVKRWETDRGLPVHRVPGGGRGSVYTFSADLDRWLQASGGPDLDPGIDPGNDAGNDAGPNTGSEAENDTAIAALPPAVSVKTSVAASIADSSETASAGFATPIPIAAARGWQGGYVSDQPSSSALASGYAQPPRRNWLRLASLAALLLAGVAGLTIGFPVLRSAAAHLSALRPANRPAPATLKAARLVSDAEQQSARELYLKGRYEWNQRTPDSLNRALDDFTQSIVHDPAYAEAYVGLADTYDLLREYSTMPESEAFSRAIVAARKAVELDDSLAEAHRALAFAEMYGSWNFADAEIQFRRAIELNPSDPVARRWYANAFAVPGRFDESLQQIDKAQELDPTSHSTLADKGVMLFNAGRPQEGIAILKDVERTVPDFRSPHYYLMRIAFESRDYPTFLEEGSKTAELSSDPVLKDVMAAARSGYARNDEQGLLANVYATQRRYFLANKLWATMLAKTCIQMGRKQEALQLLEQAYDRHEEYMVASILSHPDMLTLKNEPRYRALVAKINFPAPH